MSDASSGGAGKRRRRVRSAEEKRRIVAETYEAGASVSEVARRHDVNTNLLFTWRRAMGVDRLARAGDPTGFVPVVISAPAVTTATPLAKSPAGTMEIVLCGGERVIVDRTVDAVALARVIDVLSQRRSVMTPR
jgi:transposase